MEHTRIKSLALVLILLSSVAVGATVRRAEHECSMSAMECCNLFKELTSVGVQTPADMACCVVRGPEPVSNQTSGTLRIQSPATTQDEPVTALTPLVIPSERALGFYSIRGKPPDSKPSYIRNLSLLI